ncbi:prepilin peptidase [uncultured Rhodoblastus sp.]|uniref:A24 family peptidase n=1 Tax=uncultured Rhodoblastus sp. TaxID=543037 RepID=UPI0025F0F5DF|nr:prepilin peptidase [uncultured Rhodoblastus sp.]
MLLVFPALMAYAAFSDLFTMTISNWISVLLVIAFVGAALLVGMPAAQIGLHLACGLAVLALTFALFCFGWIGGGDAKLAATTAVWMGFEHLAEYGLGAALIGGALTLAILQFRRWPLPGWARARDWTMRLHDKDNGVPYGMALAAAGLALYPETGLFLRALAA